MPQSERYDALVLASRQWWNHPCRCVPRGSASTQNPRNQTVPLVRKIGRRCSERLHACPRMHICAPTNVRMGSLCDLASETMHFR